MSVSVTFHLMYVQIVLVRSKLLSGHLLEKSCPLSLYIVFLDNSRFGFEDMIWVLNASVSCNCFLVAFR